MRALPVSPGWRARARGVAYLGAIGVVCTLVFFMDEIRRSIIEGPEIAVTAREAEGLVPGSEVWIAGTRAGRVLSIRFADPAGPESRRVLVRAVLHHGPAERLRADARPRIVPASLLAPPVLELEPGSPSAPPLDFSDTLRIVAGITPGELLSRMGAARPRVDSLRRLSRELRAAALQGGGTLARLRSDTALSARLGRLAERARRFREQSRGPGSLALLAGDDSLRATAKRLKDRLGRLARNEGERADSLAALVETLDRVSARLRQLHNDLDAGYGTAGRALHDREIQNQLDRLRAAVDSARVEIMREPWRWLRFRLF
ncbi:MAG: MlaD family protein [Gemmatimonadota bacterium]